MTVSAAFRSAYLSSLREHVLRPGEQTLRAGYELGRRAVAEDVSVLDLAAIHHDALAASVGPAPDTTPAQVLRLAGGYLAEVLSAFEMVHRGYREAAAAAANERHKAVMLRHLSSFLADASLTARGSDAAAEIVRLVAEHARELTDSLRGTATCILGGRHLRATCSEDEPLDDDTADVLEAIESVAHAIPVRVGRDDWNDVPALRSLPGPAGGALSILTVPIEALDDRALGVLQLVGKRQGDFTETDEAVARHLARMTAASAERAELYRRGAPALM